MPKFVDMTSQVFGRLTVISVYSKCSENIQRTTFWLCRCTCGKEHAVARGNLLNGSVQSCGCIKNTQGGLIGKKKHPLWRRWQNMIDRCTNINDKDYENYGGRGIKICDRWSKLENFIADMGPCPKGLTLDRIDNNKDYCPENCRWATPLQQTNNRRCTRYINTPWGIMPISDAARRLGIPRGILATRIKLGWSKEKIYGLISGGF